MLERNYQNICVFNAALHSVLISADHTRQKVYASVSTLSHSLILRENVKSRGHYRSNDFIEIYVVT